MYLLFISCSINEIMWILFIKLLYINIYELSGVNKLFIIPNASSVIVISQFSLFNCFKINLFWLYNPIKIYSSFGLKIICVTFESNENFLNIDRSFDKQIYILFPLDIAIYSLFWEIDT